MHMFLGLGLRHPSSSRSVKLLFFVSCQSYFFCIQKTTRTEMAITATSPSVHVSFKLFWLDRKSDTNVHLWLILGSHRRYLVSPRYFPRNQFADLGEIEQSFAHVPFLILACSITCQCSFKNLDEDFLASKVLLRPVFEVCSLLAFLILLKKEIRHCVESRLDSSLSYYEVFR